MYQRIITLNDIITVLRDLPQGYSIDSSGIKLNDTTESDIDFATRAHRFRLGTINHIVVNMKKVAFLLQGHFDHRHGGARVIGDGEVELANSRNSYGLKHDFEKYLEYNVGNGEMIVAALVAGIRCDIYKTSPNVSIAFRSNTKAANKRKKLKALVIPSYHGNHMLMMSGEILGHIFSYLPKSDLKHVRHVCHSWQRWALDTICKRRQPAHIRVDDEFTLVSKSKMKAYKDLENFWGFFTQRSALNKRVCEEIEKVIKIKIVSLDKRETKYTRKCTIRINLNENTDFSHRAVMRFFRGNIPLHFIEEDLPKRQKYWRKAQTTGIKATLHSHPNKSWVSFVPTFKDYGRYRKAHKYELAYEKKHIDVLPELQTLQDILQIIPNI